MPIERKRGDSNPRYSYPYDSLANCWFQPLTHPSQCRQLGEQKRQFVAKIEKRVQRYCFFLTYANFLAFFFKKNVEDLKLGIKKEGCTSLTFLENKFRQKYKKRRLSHDNPTFSFNLKSTTMKNTVQKYCFFLTYANFCALFFVYIAKKQ